MKNHLLLLLSLILPASAFTQSFYTGGKIVGNNTNHVRLTAAHTDDNDGKFYAGNFVDSVNTNFYGGPAVTLISGNPGGKSTFLIIDNFGTINAYKLEGSTPGDSLEIASIAYEWSAGLLVGGTFYGTVDLDPGPGVSNITSPAGGSAFMALYDLSGILLYSAVLETTGNNGKITKVGFDNNNYPAAIGYFDGTIDMDPGPSSLPFLSAGAIDGFYISLDYSLLYPNYTLQFDCSGNVYPTDFLFDYNSELHIVGYFDNTLFPGSGNIVSNGMQDAFWAKYDTDYVLFQYAGFGSSTGNDKILDISMVDYMIDMLFEFNGTINMSPLNGTNNLTSAGGTDVAVGHYNYNCMHYWSRQFGNAAANPVFYGGTLRLTGSIPQSHDHSGNRSVSPDAYVFAMGFSGTVDADPSGAVKNVSSSNTARNSIIVEMDTSGYYKAHYNMQSQSCIMFAGSNYNTEITAAGNFAGNNVDIMPMGAVLPMTHTTNSAGYVSVFDRCDLTADITMPTPYACGSCNAQLFADVQNGTPPIDIYWSSTGNTTAYASGLCPGNYYVDVYDYHGCYQSPSYYIAEHNAGVELAINVTPVSSSCGVNSGSATGTALNTVGPYTIDWSNGDSGNMADSLGAGLYTVTLTDSLNCYVTESFSISDVNGPSVALTNVVHPTCAGQTTGSIDITVTGGALPLSFLWSNGATTEDLTNLTGGSYAVIVTDANGCQSQLCVTVNKADSISVSVFSFIQSNCFSADGSLTVAAAGGTPPYNYLWDANAGSQTDSTATALAAGLYNVTVTDNSGCMYTKMVALSDNTGSPVVYPDWLTSPSCVNGPGLIDIYPWGGFPYTFQWSTGETTEDISPATGGSYGVVMTDNSGCKDAVVFDLPQELPLSPEICMVTVDSANTHNVVIWNNLQMASIDYYNVYREGFCNNVDFSWVGSVDGDSLSVFDDTVMNTATRGWRYYVTSVDTCGYESLPSEIHRTIHLAAQLNASNDVLLHWDNYMGEAIDHYEIFRVLPASTQFAYLDSVSGTTTTYIDTSNLNIYGGAQVDYYVEAIPVNICYASRTFNQNASRSNKSGIMAPLDTTSSVTDLVPNLDIQIFPNPANERVTVQVNGNKGPYRLEMINPLGQPVYVQTFSGRTVISTAQLPTGVYFIRLKDADQRNLIYKLIISR